MFNLKITGYPTITVATMEDAQIKYAELRAESGEGASTWPDGKLVDVGTKEKFRISYNGRVWRGFKYQPDAEAVA